VRMGAAGKDGNCQLVQAAQRASTNRWVEARIRDFENVRLKRNINPHADAASSSFHSAVAGSMIVVTSRTRSAGKPPSLACSRIISAFGAM